ncbi:MAG: hypothetical protein A3C81_02510 [Candidatus Yanofskybacteria bacterium RIFCSPHIGHO2_02_FULL_46_19]|uniref:Uncharacterized protein n=1 Tax=Candidatus Yanofskybacteria bacterium RIFCSPHIGHO2_02_FULL_46_19 TaxID=1802684 RepID=A0A1F8FTW5_9BACT|nr:MAG: hypothetical protein A3C81_02510 [Candidatus Yanofskybacteria bacterium RIFCSPHIGHO2_02_FULL_46_19]
MIKPQGIATFLLKRLLPNKCSARTSSWRAGKRASGLQKAAQLRRKTNGRHFVPPSEWLVKNRKIKSWSG